MAKQYSYGLNKNSRNEILQGLNGHNAKVYSGMEQLFVVPLSEMDKIQLIKKYYKAIYFSDVFVVNKLAFNRYNPNVGKIETDSEPDYVDHATDENGNDITKKENYEALKAEERLFDRAWCIPIDPKKSKFNVKTQGEQKGKTYLSEVTAFVNGAGRVSVEFFDCLLDYEIAVIFKDSNGNYRILFDPVYSVETDIEQDSGEGITSSAGFTISFKVMSKRPPVYFYGRINLLAGVANYGDSEIRDLNMAEVYTVPRPDGFLDDFDDIYHYVGSGQDITTRESGI